MTGGILRPLPVLRCFERNGQTYEFEATDAEFAQWMRERNLVDEVMIWLRTKFESDDAISSAVATGEVEAWLKQQT